MREEVSKAVPRGDPEASSRLERYLHIQNLRVRKLTAEIRTLSVELRRKEEEIADLQHKRSSD